MRAGRLRALIVVMLLAGGVCPAPAAAAPPHTVWVRPVAGHLTRGFAAPAGPYGPGHRGVDFAAARGTQVVAVGDGVVVFAGFVAGAGAVVVRHPNGWRTTVAYLAAVTVVAGERVRRGQAVGRAGGRGPAHDGSVVHLGLRIGDRYADPMRLFAPRNHVRLVPLRPAASGAG